MERAADWIFSHANQLDAPMETDQAEDTISKCRDGPGSKLFLICGEVLSRVYANVIHKQHKNALKHFFHNSTKNVPITCVHVN